MIKNKDAREAARAAGKTKFDLGVPCKNGHFSLRHVSDGKCVSCTLETKARKIAKNPEARAKADAAYYKKNKLRISDRNRSYYENNKDAIAEYGASYREINRDKVRERVRKRYAENSCELRAISSRIRAMRSKRFVYWGEEHSEKTKHVEKACHEAAVHLEKETGVQHSMDHMIPLMGRLVCGLHVWNNLQVLPADVNRRKQNKFILTEIGESSMQEPDWYRDAIAFYKEAGWDFRKSEYVSGPYCRSHQN